MRSTLSGAHNFSMPAHWANAAYKCAARLRSMWSPPVYKQHTCETIQRLHVTPAVLAGSNGAAGQTVAIVDEGEASFLHYAQMPSGALKLLGTIDARPGEQAGTFAPNKARQGLKPRGRGCTVEEWNNHVAKTAAFAYWSEPTHMHTARATCPTLGHANMSAHGTSMVSVRFATRLYVAEGGSSPTPLLLDQYISGLVLALQSVLRHRKVLRITTVQISAVDGIFKGAEYWEAAAPAKFARFRNLTQQLARANVWVSAPTGNAYGADDVTRIGWPASNAGVIAVGCATSSGAPDGNFSAEIGGVLAKMHVRPRRSPHAPNQLLTTSLQPFTSQCNAILCATSMVARELLARRCGVNPAAVPIAALRRAMIASARRVADREIGSEHMLVVDDGSLYERLRIFDCAIISQARDTK